MEQRQPIPAWVGITYLLYLVMWVGLVVGGTGYAVFVLGRNGWWWALAVLLLSGTYRPGRWAEIVTGDTGPAHEWRKCRCHSVDREVSNPGGGSVA